eukprot:TRINITY_DN7247_c0_g1_i7.p1 TRINITY_DN7247_c0_g1~~TRINITY_DN7247_c0_g1_i7.p1  ORF type:complete len:227 (+),score=73.04 TRINITY_DN7247_c0_g1_i7:244-924(+)
MAASSVGSIGYGFVARCPECVLVEVSLSEQTSELNPAVVARKILRTIDGQTDTKMSYTYSKHYFHYMVKSNLVYLCMAEQSFSRRNCFQFLNDIAGRFETSFGERGATAGQYEMNEEFHRIMQNQMEFFSKHRDQTHQVKEEIDQVKDLLSKGIEKVIDRGEQIDLLVDRSQELSRDSYSFRRTSTDLKRAMMCQNLKMILIMTGGVVVALLLILMMFCGFNLKGC